MYCGYFNNTLSYCTISKTCNNPFHISTEKKTAHTSNRRLLSDVVISFTTSSTDRTNHITPYKPALMSPRGLNATIMDAPTNPLTALRI